MANFGDDLYTEELKKLCWGNAEYFKKDETENGQRLRLAFLGIIDHVSSILPLVYSVQKVMSKYDYDENTPGNGFRSYVYIAYATFRHAMQLSNYVAINRESLIFRKGFYMKEVEAVAHMIASLASCFQHLQLIMNWTEPGNLFPASDHHAEIVLDQCDTINQYAFYGRCLGIQYSSSVQPLLKFISTFMASFSEVYYNLGGLSSKAQSLVSGGKFLIDPELRARRIVNISLYASIDFCKAFWFLAESELMKKVPDFVCNAVAINNEIEIPPEPLKIENSSGTLIDIPIPSSHIKVSSILVRLLSSVRREGMIAVSSDQNKKCPVAPTSNSLILHCHGGGFVAQSSKSHEVYLRDWANSLGVPIVSVDYSLAPKAPFPRALEEVFYAYCWTLKNAKILGSTGERIILAGDSAGANLVLGTTLKTIEYGIRKPDGLFVAYVPVIVSSTPSPSRLLCLMDPLLPIGFLLRCLKAYALPPEPEPPQASPKEKRRNSKKQIHHNSVKFYNSDSHGKQNQSLTFHTESTKTTNYCAVAECSVSVDSPFRKKELDSNKHSESENSSVIEKTFTLAEEALPDVPKNLESNDKNLKNAFNCMKKRVSSMLANTFKMSSRKDIDKTLSGEDIENLVNPFKEFKFSVPRDPYLSPYWAPDNWLNQLPPTNICTVQFDPCLDDCVMFAKKLKTLGNVVHIDILQGLPHGFLNFCKVNKDAEEASKLCIERMKELLKGETSPSAGTAPKKNGVNEAVLANGL